MSDTYTADLGFRQIATGTQPNSWGAILNSMFQQVDTAIAGEALLSIGSSVAYSWPAIPNGADGTSRYFCVQVLGTPAAGVVITLPSSITNKFYLIDNQTGQTLKFQYTGSDPNNVTVNVGEKRLIWCNGLGTYDVVTASVSSLAGVAIGNLARVSRTAAEIAASTIVTNVFMVPSSWPYTTLTLPGGSTITLDCDNGNKQRITITGNYTMGVPANPTDGAEIDLSVIQDGTGGRLLTWNSVFLFQNGAQPTLSVVGGGIDRFLMSYDATLGKWLVAVFSNVTTPSGAAYPLTIAANVTNWKLAPLLGTLGSPITVTITVNTGIQVRASSPAEYAMDLSGLPSGSTVNLVNMGLIQGHGGDGGDGAGSEYPGSGNTSIGATVGKNGGGAVLGPGLSHSFTVSNANGRIWGGGGGGGGGGAAGTTGAQFVANAGGGGGGAGGGRPGRGGRVAGAGTYSSGTVSANGADGNYGTEGIAGAGGTAGAGYSNGAGNFGASGAGGAFGAAGTAGTAPSSNTFQPAVLGAAGAAGKAIELQGAAAPTVGGSVLGLIS